MVLSAAVCAYLGSASAGVPTFSPAAVVYAAQMVAANAYDTGCYIIAISTIYHGLRLTVNLAGDSFCLLLPDTFYHKRTPNLWSAFNRSISQFIGYLAGAIAVLFAPTLNPRVLLFMSFVSTIIAAQWIAVQIGITILMCVRSWGYLRPSCNNTTGYSECTNANGGDRGRQKNFRKSYR